MSDDDDDMIIKLKQRYQKSYYYTSVCYFMIRMKMIVIVKIWLMWITYLPLLQSNCRFKLSLPTCFQTHALLKDMVLDLIKGLLFCH